MDPYDDTRDFRALTEYRFSLSVMSGRKAFARITHDGLPEPLRRIAEQMDAAQTDDEARAVAHEFLLLSKEWSD